LILSLNGLKVFENYENHVYIICRLKCALFIHSSLKQTEVVNELRRLRDKFVLLPADKASDNIVFV
jgi:hypothetical protein